MMIQSRKTVVPDRVGEYAGGVLLLQVQEQLHQGLHRKKTEISMLAEVREIRRF
jgi:hypothetical protein